MSRRDELRWFDEAWDKHVAWFWAVTQRQLASPCALQSATTLLSTELLPRELRARLMTELDALLPALIERLHAETRATLVDEVKAEARATLAEFGET